MVSVEFLQPNEGPFTEGGSGSVCLILNTVATGKVHVLYNPKFHFARIYKDFRNKYSWGNFK